MSVFKKLAPIPSRSSGLIHHHGLSLSYLSISLALSVSLSCSLPLTYLSISLSLAKRSGSSGGSGGPAKGAAPSPPPDLAKGGRCTLATIPARAVAGWRRQRRPCPSILLDASEPHGARSGYLEVGGCSIQPTWGRGSPDPVACDLTIVSDAGATAAATARRRRRVVVVGTRSNGTKIGTTTSARRMARTVASGWYFSLILCWVFFDFGGKGKMKEFMFYANANVPCNVMNVLDSFF